MTGPGRPIRVGHLHPLMTVERDLREIFHAFGFEVFEGPEIETEAMNFEALNIPPDHPSRDLWDTCTWPSPAASRPGARVPPSTARSCAPTPARSRSGPCTRSPRRSGSSRPGAASATRRSTRATISSSSRSRGWWSTETTSLADLKGMLEEFARALYGEATRTRFRPGYYPFTEPSVAFDIACLVCGGSGCAACGRTGWMTILGAGMVHPTVLEAGGIDPDALPGLRVRDGARPDHPAASRGPRPPPSDGRRPALPRPVPRRVARLRCARRSPGSPTTSTWRSRPRHSPRS